MKKRMLSFSKIVSVFSLFLTLFPFAVKARVIGASKDKCLRDDSQAISRVFGGTETAGALHSASDVSSAPIHFELADSLVYMQASINGSMPLWMMLDTGASVTVFDESVSKAWHSLSRRREC